MDAKCPICGGKPGYVGLNVIEPCDKCAGRKCAEPSPGVLAPEGVQYWSTRYGSSTSNVPKGMLSIPWKKVHVPSGIAKEDSPARQQMEAAIKDTCVEMSEWLRSRFPGSGCESYSTNAARACGWQVPQSAESA